ncbi:hypothetical protein SH501x_004865 [Pirellulaceae bacterium SH501]
MMSPVTSFLKQPDLPNHKAENWDRQVQKHAAATRFAALTSFYFNRPPEIKNRIRYDLQKLARSHALPLSLVR